MFETVTLGGLVLFIIIVLVVLLYLSVRIVNEYDRLVVFRLGRTGPDKIKGPGLVFLIPVVDRPVRVDLREQFIEVPSQTHHHQGQRAHQHRLPHLLAHRRPAAQSIVNVAYFAGALQGIATTTLRAVIGDILLDDVLSKRDQINEVLRTKLDEQTERWGGKVTTVEIREIIPPRDVQDAMNRMLSAERNRRAVITESEGARQSAINVAEGEKQSAILRAEGKRQSAILEAEGFSQALERIYWRARDRSTSGPCCCSTSRPSRPSVPAPRPSTSSPWSSPGWPPRWVTSWTGRSTRTARSRWRPDAPPVAGSSPDAPSMGTTGGLRSIRPEPPVTGFSAPPEPPADAPPRWHPRRPHGTDARPRHGLTQSSGTRVRCGEVV